MHYLIDGYNFLFSYSDESGSFQKEREKLIHSLAVLAANSKEKFTLIFDAPHTPDSLSVEFQTPLKIIYTPSGICADKYFIEYLQGQKKTGGFCIVTNDRRLMNECYDMGASAISISEFKLKRMKKVSAHKKPEKPSRSHPKIRDHYIDLFEKRLKDSEDLP